MNTNASENNNTPHRFDRFISVLETIASNLEKISLKLDDVEAAIDRHGSILSSLDTGSITSTLADIESTLTAMDASISMIDR